MTSIGTILDRDRGLGRGFDFLRVALAFAVLTWHIPEIAGIRTQYGMPFLWLTNYAVLMLFFGLSGFLITGSAMRLSLGNFLINRGLRIFPALAVEVVLCALVIGPLVTSLPLAVYFTQGQTVHYFTNIVALINYRLPGVFEANPEPVVNMSLWTVPYEMGCYAIMSGFILLRLLRRPGIALAIAAAWIAAGLTLAAIYPHEPPHHGLTALLSNLFYGRGSRLFVAFTMGIVAYLYRHRLPYSWPLFAVAVGYVTVFAGLGSTAIASPVVAAATVVPLTYIMAFLGVTKLPRLPFFHRGDYSYGLYLYGWPATQVLLLVVPALRTSLVGAWLATAALATLIAAASWHLIEKPILKQRRKFSFVARQRIAEAGPEPALAGGEHDRPLPAREAAPVAF